LRNYIAYNDYLHIFFSLYVKIKFFLTRNFDECRWSFLNSECNSQLKDNIFKYLVPSVFFFFTNNAFGKNSRCFWSFFLSRCIEKNKL